MDIQQRQRSRIADVDMRRLRQFVALAEAGSFTRAARLLNIAQPALSVSIRRLEQDIGSLLFNRESRGVQLTRSGEVLLEEARRLLLQANRMIDAVQAVSHGIGGTLRVGFVTSATFGLLQRLIPAFRAANPATLVTLHEVPNSGSAIRWLRHQRIDTGIVRTPLSEDCPMQTLELERDHFSIALPEGHRFAAMASIPLQMLKSEPFIMYRETDAPGIRSAAMLACHQAGFEPRITQEATQITTLLSLAASGLGVALVPWTTRRLALPNVVCRPILDPPEAAQTGLSLLYDEGSEPASARAFRNICLDYLSKPADVHV